ncbi:MAG: TRAM domain-containing protein [Tissierellia bacterium]|nr:TRAM domain-containing protein [Tissierellia bacterium]
MGAGVGLFVTSIINLSKLLAGFESELIITVAGLIIIFLFALIFFVLSPKVLKAIENLLKLWEDQLKDKALTEIIWGATGLILGLIIAFLISQPLNQIPIPYFGFAITVVLYGMLGYLGLRIGLSNKDDLTIRIREVTNLSRKSVKEKSKIEKYDGIPKILDTSVIIDGRILEICRSGFLEGPLVVATFVLEELQHIADSSDGLKRNRGRRGLDVVKALQEEGDLEVIIFQEDYPEIGEVDSKLLKLTKELKGKIVTNDFNLNKVASVQTLKVLNINELANAVKPAFLPGEELEIQIVKSGKEQNQGLGYLDDGTMIVVENGKHLMGQKVEVVVTSALQTAAGKMIFAKPKSHI